MVSDASGRDPRPFGRVVRRVRLDPEMPVDLGSWPGNVPAVAQILRDDLELQPGVTILAGENGSGKSTIVEMLAEACRLNPQGGSAGSGYRTRDSEPGIGRHLVVEREPGPSGWSYFLRADTMHDQYSYLEANPGKTPDRFHEMSHGEGWKCSAPGSTSRVST